jgi:hypothetical protein
MTLLLILLAIAALAVLAPRYGIDSRNLDGPRSAPPWEDKLWSRQP